jgi:hypothetical protein
MKEKGFKILGGLKVTEMTADQLNFFNEVERYKEYKRKYIKDLEWTLNLKTYEEYCFSWYMYLKNSTNLSKKDEQKKLICKKELERIENEGIKKV